MTISSAQQFPAASPIRWLRLVVATVAFAFVSIAAIGWLDSKCANYVGPDERKHGTQTEANETADCSQPGSCPSGIPVQLDPSQQKQKAAPTPEGPSGKEHYWRDDFVPRQCG